MPEFEEHDHSCCSACCPVENCNEWHDEDYDDEPEYDDYEEDDDMPGWNRPPNPQDADIDGRFIRPTRTVGCEFEMETDYGTDESNERIRSLGAGIGSDHCGVEVRTPPVKGKQADDVLAGILSAMLEGGHRPGRSAGLHVHVHVPEAMQPRTRDNYDGGSSGTWYTRNNWSADGEYRYTADDPTAATAFSRLYALWYAAEHITYRFDPTRRRNTYSEQLYRNRQSRIEAVDRALTAAAEGRLPRVDSGRYNSMNVNGGYGTVEFRNHGSTDDVPHMLAWVAFVQGMVDLSQKVSFITIRRIARAKTHNERARLLMNAARRHGVFTPTAYQAIRNELGLARGKRVQVRRAA